MKARVKMPPGRREIARNAGFGDDVRAYRASLAADPDNTPKSKDELMEVADVRRWQVEALGEGLLRALGNSHPSQGSKPKVR